MADESTGDAKQAGVKCFHICPIGKADTTTRKRSDQIFKHIVKATLEPLGYTTVRADQVEESGTITSQIISGLLDSDLVTADLTDHNPNVFYELAIRHVAAKPFVQLIADDQNLPFDVQGLRTIRFDYRDLDSVHAAKRELSGMVATIQSGKPVETPVNYTLNLQSLKQSDDAEARGIADIITELASVKQDLRLIMRQDARRNSGASRAERDAITLLNFLDSLAVNGRLDAEDIRRLMEEFDVSPTITRWAGRLIEKHFKEESPF